MSLVRRLDKIAATLAAKQSSLGIVHLVKGDEDPEIVLDRMIANGEIAEHQRSDVLLIRMVAIEPIWEMSADGSARLIGRRNVHTGEVERVDGHRGLTVPKRLKGSA
jgi:hypothetical protein